MLLRGYFFRKSGLISTRFSSRSLPSRIKYDFCYDSPYLLLEGIWDDSILTLVFINRIVLPFLDYSSSFSLVNI